MVYQFFHQRDLTPDDFDDFPWRCTGGLTPDRSPRRSQTASPARMELFVDRLQAAVFDVSIDLRRADAGVAKHFLERSDVRATGQQMIKGRGSGLI